MNLGSDPADQVVRYTLEGTEYALRLSGTAAKNFAIFVAAVLRDQKKTRGKNLPRKPNAMVCCLSRYATAMTQTISKSQSGPMTLPR